MLKNITRYVQLYCKICLSSPRYDMYDILMLMLQKEKEKQDAVLLGCTLVCGMVLLHIQYTYIYILYIFHTWQWCKKSD